MFQYVNVGACCWDIVAGWWLSVYQIFVQAQMNESVLEVRLFGIVVT